MLNFLFGRPPARRAASDPAGYTEADFLSGADLHWHGRRTQAGTVVSEEMALTYGAVWCATRVLSETCAIPPPFLYRRGPKDSRELAVDEPLFDVLHTRPNPAMGRTVWAERSTAHQVNWGGGFSEIERDDLDDPESRAVALWPIHPGRVRPATNRDQYQNGAPVEAGYYVVRNNDGTQTTLAPWEMLHFPGVGADDGIWGKGTIAYARENIGMGLAVERHGATSFGSGNMPRVVIQGTGFKEREQRANFRKEWRELHGSSDSAEVALLQGVDAKVTQLTIPNDQAQFLETRTFNVRDIARIYRVPAHKLGDLEKAGYNSIEQLSIEFIMDSIMPWLLKQRDEMMLKLLTPQQRRALFVDHQLAALLKGDLKTRFEAYSIALSNGWMTINEVRALENLNGIGPKGDRHFVALNTVPLDRVDDALDAKNQSLKSPTPPAGAGPGPTEEMDAKRIDEVRRVAGNLKFLEVRKAADAAPVVPLAACRSVLKDVLRRMLTKEANAVRRFLKDPAFEARLAEFHAGHRLMLREALAPAADLLAAVGLSAGAEELAERLLSGSKDALLTLYEKDTVKGFEAALGRWDGRAENLTDEWLRAMPAEAN